MAHSVDSIDQLCINSIRTLSIDAIQKANSGHPGLPMGAAPMAYALWQRHLRFDPSQPDWPDRDRFVLSPGHGSALLYSLLHLYGYELSIEDMQDFRQLGSRTPGHPEFGWTPGVEATTGPLGQGTANSVGMAMAERWLGAHYNRTGHEIVDHYSFAIVSDGDLMEGIAYEAASIAGQLKLNKLIWLYDANDISLDGPLTISFSEEDIAKRFESQGWHVQTILAGDTDVEGIGSAIANAKKQREQPSIIIVKTTIGYGSPNKAGTSSSHGSPLGDEEVQLTKQALGWEETEAFSVPSAAAGHFEKPGQQGHDAREEWESRFARYREAHPELAAEWALALAGGLPDGWDADIPSWDAGESVATRVAGGKILNAVAAKVPFFLGGDADLSCSTKTAIDGEESFLPATHAGRNLHFGVREHAMGAIANGFCYHGGVRPFVSTFFCFSDYMRGAVRLAALSELRPIYVWTHDSVCVGEDGPTHQPVEHLMSLRLMPGLTVLRPAHANETAAAWRWTMAHAEGPVALVLSRQNLQVFESEGIGIDEGVSRGAYIVAEATDGNCDLILLASGSELGLAMDARETLQAEGIRTRVVSMPSFELFSAQDAAYREAILPAAVSARVSIEAGVTLGWERWVGSSGATVGVDRFGASAPGDEVMLEVGLSADQLVKAAKRVLAD